MNYHANKKHSLTRLSLCILAALGSSYSLAEEVPKEAEVERITITGSNIKRATDIGALPVTTLNEKDIENIGAMTGDELLRSIPQMGEINFGAETGSGGVNDARGDVSSINLRGIGSGNTLTLLNGRRIVTHPGTQSENFVPVSTVNSNTLPVSGIRSLQVLRDGAAAIYGSDAVAGREQSLGTTSYRVCLFAYGTNVGGVVICDLRPTQSGAKD